MAKIPADAGVGVIFKGADGTEYVTVPPETPRRVTYRVSSFRGMSPGATHWYSSLNVPCLHVRVLSLPKSGICYELGVRWTVGVILHISGAFEKRMPEGARSMRIDVEREITEEDRNSGRFKHYGRIGTTDRWNSYEDAVKAARLLFRKTFDKGWKLVASRDNRNFWRL
jgi:hypothetical protein